MTWHESLLSFRELLFITFVNVLLFSQRARPSLVGGIIGCNGWVRELFIERAGLFLAALEARWERGRREAEGVSRLLERHGVGRGSILVELGCGNGRVGIPLALMGYWLVCLDISGPLLTSGVEHARLEGAGHLLEFVEADASHLPLRGSVVDGVYVVWTSVLGYVGEDYDFAVLREARRVVRPGGLLAVVNTANYERLVKSLAGSQGQLAPTVQREGDYIVVEESEADLVRGIVRTRWTYYREEGKNLVYVDSVEACVRLYTLHELVELASKASWVFEAAYHDLEKFRGFIPGLSGFNVVFRRSGGVVSGQVSALYGQGFNRIRARECAWCSLS
jgi:SAM-dependent methyltransferase